FQSVRRRARSFDQRFRDCLTQPGFERGRQFIQEIRDVMVERRNVEMLCGGKLFHLLAPTKQQSVSSLPDQHREFVMIDVHFYWRYPNLLRRRDDRITTIPRRDWIVIFESRWTS